MRIIFFGKELIAPCDADVVKVILGVIEDALGVENKEQLTGNTIVLKTALNEYIVRAS